MAAEQQVSRDEQHQLDSHDRNEQTGNEQRCTDEHFGKWMAAALFLFLLGSDYLDFALDIRADFADFGEQRIRIVALDAQLLGLVDQHAIVDAVQLADLVLHFGGTVCAAEVFERVNALTVLAVMLGLGCNDLGVALDGRADLADFRQERIRVFAGYAQLLGLKHENAVLYALEFADALLHFCRAVCTADILQRVNALDAVRACRMFVVMVVLVLLVLIVVVMVSASAVAVIVMMVVVLVPLLLIVVVMVSAAAVAVIVMMMVMLVFILIVVMRMPAAAVAFIFIVFVVMMFVLMHFFI